MAISSTTASSAFFTSSSKIGSPRSRWSISTLYRDYDVAEGVQARGAAERHQRRSIVLLDEKRARPERLIEIAAADHRRRNEALPPTKISSALARRHRPGAGDGDPPPAPALDP